MRYFRIFDEISDEGGDLYRWDAEAKDLRMRLGSGEYSTPDFPRRGQSVEEYLTYLAGDNGEWKEVDGPEA